MDMFGLKQKFSVRFYLGILLVILSLLIGKITQAVFVIYFGDKFLRWLSVIIYVLSWPVLVLGVWWVGKEYAESLRKYFTYKFYHESMKRGTKKVYGATREKTRNIKEKVKGKVKRIREY